MQIGIIAEGRSDQAVLTNILKGILNIDDFDITYLRPDIANDITDAKGQNKTFGGWTYVKKECEDKELLLDFFRNEDDEYYVVIQIDTAEADHEGFEVKKPSKEDENYDQILRERIIAKIQSWLGKDFEYLDRIFYAISVESIDAWVLSIYANENTSQSANPKRKLDWAIRNEKKLFRREGNFEDYIKLTKKFSKLKELKKYLARNQSLHLFTYSFEEKAEQHILWLLLQYISLRDF